jgi:hypothetical protein
VAVPEEIEAVARRVRERAPGDRQALLLATVSGLGYYAALLVLAGIGDVSCFPTARRLWSYAGLVPSTYASGRAVRHAAIAKRGFSFLRWALVETAMHAVRRPGPLQEFYRRLLVGKGAHKAKVAPAGKLSRAVFWMLSMSRFYRKVGSCLAPGGRRTRTPTWPVAKARVVTLQCASHAGHVVLAQGRGVSWAVLVARRLVARREVDMSP